MNSSWQYIKLRCVDFLVGIPSEGGQPFIGFQFTNMARDYPLRKKKIRLTKTLRVMR